MPQIVYSSSLDEAHRDEVEQILFFNAHQGRTSEAVAFVAERYGVPRVATDDDGRLRVGLASSVQTQTLFALLREGERDRAVGVVVYTREDDAFVILFVAVHEEFSSRGNRAGLRVLLQMTNEIKAIARRVKGVDSLLVYLGRTTPTRVRVGRPTPSNG